MGTKSSSKKKRLEMMILSVSLEKKQKKTVLNRDKIISIHHFRDRELCLF